MSVGVGDAAERIAAFVESLRHCLAHRLVIVALPDCDPQSLESSPSVFTRIRNSDMESPWTGQLNTLAVNMQSIASATGRVEPIT